MHKPLPLLSGLALILLSAYWWHSQNEQPNTRSTTPDTPLLTLEHSTTYRYALNGQRNTTLSAEHSEHYRSGRGTDLTNPDLSHHTPPYNHYTLSAASGHISADKNTITFTHNVIAERHNGRIRDAELTTTQLTYRRDTNTIYTKQPITFTTPTSQTQATGALWRLLENSLILEQNIRTHYDAAPNPH